MTDRRRLPSARRHDSPPRGLAFNQLSPLERSIVAELANGPRTIGDLARELLGAATGDQRARIGRALRRVVRERFAHRTARGTYAAGPGERRRRR
jgi:hypothetical protein